MTLALLLLLGSTEYACNVLYKLYMPIIFYSKAFFQIFTFEKNLNLCSECLLHLFRTRCLTLSLVIPETLPPTFFFAFILY